MELWQLDVVGGVLLADGTECKVLTGIDDHSRFVVAAGVMTRAVSRAVCGHFADALRRYGVPDEVLTDNGKVFTDRFGRTPAEVLFDRICRENGITHRLTAPRSPTTTGKIERFHRTLARRVPRRPRLRRSGRRASASSTPGSPTTTPSGPTPRATCNRPSAGSESIVTAPAPELDPHLVALAGRPRPRRVDHPQGRPSTGSSPSPGSRSRSASTATAAASTSTSSPRSSRSGTATS